MVAVAVVVAADRHAVAARDVSTFVRLDISGALTTQPKITGYDKRECNHLIHPDSDQVPYVTSAACLVLGHPRNCTQKTS